MGDQLFPVYNNFFIGNYQVAINDGYELQGLSEADALERATAACTARPLRWATTSW